MKKIMFSTKYGLQQRVIARTKTMTRRVDKRLNHPLVTEISRHVRITQCYVIFN